MSNYYDSIDPNEAYWGPMGRMGQPNTPGLPPVQAPPPPPPSQVGGPPMPPPMQPQGGHSAFPPPTLDPFSKAQADAAAIIQGPNPPDRGPGMPGPGVGTKNPAPMPQQQGPMAGGPQRPPMPPPMPGQGGPGMTSGGGGASVPFNQSTDWAAATGLVPTGGDRMTSMMAGLGKGMTAGAGNKNSAGAAFMRGAGGAVTGQISEAQEQQKLKLGLRNEYYNQVSNTFKQAMLEKSTDAHDLYWQARAQKDQALAQVGVKQPWNADAIALAKAEDEARKNYATDRADLMEASKAGVITPEEATKQFTALQAKKGQYFTDSYKKYAVDPEKAEKIRTQGLPIEKPFSQVKTGEWYFNQAGHGVQKKANDNTYAPGDTVKSVYPYDTKGMTLPGFHQTVPNQAYFTTPAGLHQRDKPPPDGAGPTDPRRVQQLQQSVNQDATSDAMTDAMTGGGGPQVGGQE